MLRWMIDFQKSINTLEELSELACEEGWYDEFSDSFFINFMWYTLSTKGNFSIKDFIIFNTKISFCAKWKNY